MPPPVVVTVIVPVDAPKQEMLNGVATIDIANSEFIRTGVDVIVPHAFVTVKR